MHGDLSGRQREDQPAASDIDVPILQGIAEELAARLRVLAVDDGVGADDLHCAKIEDPEAFEPPGPLKSFERSTGFEPATFALARRDSTRNYAHDTPDYLLDSAMCS